MNVLLNRTKLTSAISRPIRAVSDFFFLPSPGQPARAVSDFFSSPKLPFMPVKFPIIASPIEFAEYYVILDI